MDTLSHEEIELLYNTPEDGGVTIRGITYIKKPLDPRIARNRCARCDFGGMCEGIGDIVNLDGELKIACSVMSPKHPHDHARYSFKRADNLIGGDDD